MKKPNKAKADDLKSGHVTSSDGNVFADLGFSPEESVVLLAKADARIQAAEKIKAEAAEQLASWIRQNKLTQAAASGLLEVSRPRVSDLVNRKLTRFSLDSLVTLLLRAGKRVDLVVR